MSATALDPLAGCLLIALATTKERDVDVVADEPAAAKAASRVGGAAAHLGVNSDLIIIVKRATLRTTATSRQ